MANHPQRIRAIADELQHHDDVHQRLNQIADLVAERQETAKRDRLADELVKVSKAASEEAAENGPLSLEDRAKVSKAVTPAQLKYLREVSPAAAAAYEQSRAV
jgi:hypothetical protein